MYQFMPVSASNITPQSLMAFGGAYQNPIQIPGTVDQSIAQLPQITNAPGQAGNGLDALGIANVALGGLQTLGNLWGAFQANKLAKKQFGLTKKVTETNLANQIKSYNTALEDRSRSRAFTEGQSAEEAQSYIDKNKLKSFG